MSWEVQPEPEDDAERAALLAAAESAVTHESESTWWRSGFDDLGDGPAPEQARRGAGIVET